MDRSIAPKVAELEEFDFLKAKTIKLKNGIQLHYINGGDQDVLKVELLFDAGYRFQDSPLQAAAVNQLLTEGTKNRSATDIAELFESKGAFIDHSFQADNAGIHMHCLSRHLDELFPVLVELTQESIFPEEEIENFKELKKQKFLVNQEKVSFLAKNNFASTIFGESHPYNNGIAEADFALLQKERLVDFYQSYYQNKPFHVFISGKVEEESIEVITKSLEKLEPDSIPTKNLNYTISPAVDRRLYIERPQASQSAIRLGAASISKRDADFPALYFVNTLLGGFFGSRLMSNLREDKGYTYGVGSGIMSYEKAAYFFITTEVGAEHTLSALSEIEKEVIKLRTEAVNEAEINTVRNYLLGSIMRNFDGPFAAMDRFKSLQLNQIDYSYYQNLIETFKTIDSDSVLKTSLKYLNFDQLREIVAGKI